MLPQAGDMNKASSLDLHKSNANNFCEGRDKMLSKKSMWVGDKLLLSLTAQIRCGLTLQRKHRSNELTVVYPVVNSASNTWTVIAAWCWLSF